MSCRLDGPTIDNPHPCLCAAKSIGASIDRMLQDGQYIVVRRMLPMNPCPAALANDRKLEFRIVQPEDHLSCTAQLNKLAEDKADGVDDSLSLGLCFTGVGASFTRPPGVGD